MLLCVLRDFHVCLLVGNVISFIVKVGLYEFIIPQKEVLLSNAVLHSFVI